MYFNDTYWCRNAVSNSGNSKVFKINLGTQTWGKKKGGGVENVYLVKRFEHQWNKDTDNKLIDLYFYVLKIYIVKIIK